MRVVSVPQIGPPTFFSIMKPPFAQRVAGSLLGEHFWKTLCHLSHRFTKVEVCLARRSIGVMAGGPLRPRGARWGPPSSSQLPWPTFLTLSYTAKPEKPYATPAVARSFFYSCFAESYLKKPYNAHTHTASILEIRRCLQEIVCPILL